ncbi:MAG TPA: hypothetical protein VFJ82_26225 [Longimicrobium sp.]|nr:hypothetical protein [Longimicrobium sp.]
MPRRRPQAIAPPALALAALVALASCGRDTAPRAHATTAGVPDPAREALVRTLEPRVAARLRPMLRDSLRVVVTPSAVIPAFRYHWGTWTPPGADSALHAVAAMVGAEGYPIRNAHEWSYAVSRVRWSPASVRQAAIACAEAARAGGAHPREENDLYLGPRSLRGWAVRDTAALRRLGRPEVTRVRAVFNRFRADVWIGEPGQSSRYRCLFTPRTGRRGPLAEFARTDSVAGTGLPSPDPR